MVNTIFRIPKKLAVPAGAEAVNAQKAKIAAQARSEAKTEAELEEISKEIDGREVFIEAKSGGKERLYGSITPADIAEAIEKTAGVTIDKRKIKLDEPIHQLGSYDITIKLTSKITPTVRLTVTALNE